MSKKIKSVEIEPGCTACGSCEFIAPEVFEVDNTCYVNKDADFQKNDEKIREAAKICPVWVIDFSEE